MAQFHEEEKMVQGGPPEDDSGLIWVTEFNEGSAQGFVQELLKASEKDKHKPLFIYIDSYGGQADALSTMLAVMDAVPNPLVTICMGKAMSCGAILLSHGDHRYIVPTGRVMIHEAASGTMGNINDLKVDVAETNRLNERMMGLLAQNCGKSLKTLLKMFTNKKRDVYLSPQEAVELGIADKIGFPKLKKLVRYEIE